MKLHPKVYPWIPVVGIFLVLRFALTPVGKEAFSIMNIDPFESLTQSTAFLISATFQAISCALLVEVISLIIGR